MQHEEYENAFEGFKNVILKATDAYNCAKGNDIKRINCSNVKMFCHIMINCYDKDLKYFIPFHSLTRKKKDIIASLIKEEMGRLLRDLKIVKQKRTSTAKMFEAITNKTEENYAIFGELNYCLQSGKYLAMFVFIAFP